jgi:hypothetical protein
MTSQRVSLAQGQKRLTGIHPLGEAAGRRASGSTAPTPDSIIW